MARHGPPPLSPSVLKTHLIELCEAVLIETEAEGYVLTALGRELQTLFTPLAIWAEKRAKAVG